MKTKLLLPMFCMLHMYVVRNVFFANSKLILYIENKDHNNANYYTLFQIIFVLTKANVVYRCISLTSILNKN